MPPDSYSRWDMKRLKCWEIRPSRDGVRQDTRLRRRIRIDSVGRILTRMTVKKGFAIGMLLLLLGATGAQSEQSGSYVGSSKCAPCHFAINDTWQKTRHAKAIESLKKSGQETLPACVKC